MNEHDSPETVSQGARRRLWRRRPAFRAGGGLSLRRLALAALSISGGLVTLAAVAAGVIAWRLGQGPIAVEWLQPRIKAALEEHLKQGYSFDVGETLLDKGEHGPAVTVAGLKLKDPAGRVLMSAPSAAVAVNGYAAALGSIVATRLALTGLDVRFAVAMDGGISVSAGGGEGLPLALPAPPPAAAEGGAPPVETQPASTPAGTGAAATATRALGALLSAVSDPESPFGALDHFSIAHGRLVFDDPAQTKSTVLEGLEVAFDKSGSQSNLALAVKGPSGDWSLNAQSAGAAGAARSLRIEIRDISLDEIGLVIGARSQLMESDMPISATLTAAVDASGAVTAAAAKFAVGAGALNLGGAGPAGLLRIDEITGALVFDPQAGRVVVETLRLDAGQTHVAARGTLTPPRGADAGWAFAITSDEAALGPERPGEPALAVAKSLFNARYLPAEKLFALDQFEMEGPEFGVKGSAWISGADPKSAFKLDATMRKMPIRAALRLWPGFLAAETRAWFVQHLRGGVMDSAALKLDYDADTLADALAKKPLPDASARFDFAVSSGGIELIPGLPPVMGVDGAGHVTGRTASFNATKGGMDLGGGKKLTFPDWSFSVKDLEAKPALATLQMHVLANMDAINGVFANEAFKSFHALPSESQNIKGQADAQLTFDLKLGKKMGPDDIALRATANLTALTVDNFLGREKLENGALAVTLGKDGLRARGEGRAFGAPVAVEIRKPPAGAGEATAALTLDEAARARLGFALGPGLSGPIGARVTAASGQGDDAKARVELDLTRAAIDGLLPGWSKPAGKPGKASFTLQSGGETLRLEQIAVEAGGVSFGGAAQFTPEGKFVSAKISNLRLGPGEDMEAEASQTSEALKLSLKGGSVDARPFLSALISQQGEGRGPKDIDLELKANALIGHNKQSLAGAEIKMARRAGQLRSLSVSGRFGAQPLNVSLIRKDGPVSIVARTQDAGAALSFLDLYRRMQGGTLDLTMKLADGGRQDGAVTIQDFVLKDEPAMQRLAANGAAPAGNGGGQKPLDPSSVAFTRMTASFTRAGGRTDIRDGVMFGQQIGATISGSVDFARNSVDLNGAFVPAYEVNNLFARVPVLGPLLGGNKNEGLFAVNYRVTGPVSAPVLRVNPLSAIAPGFLRTIFGAMDGTRPAAGPAGEAVAAPAPR